MTIFSIGNGDVDIRTMWVNIYKLGVRQGVGVMLFDGLHKLVSCGLVPGELQPSQDIKRKWLSDCLRLESLCSAQYRAANELADVYAGHDIRTIVLKGIAAGICYPVPNHRPCGDLDCFLMGEYERGNVIAEAVGAKVARDFYKHSHINYKGLEVENHQFCTAIRGSRRMKSFERLLQSLLKDEGTTLIGETHLECPSPLFNALFLTHHSHQHYLSEGIALRHLCDWAMFLKTHGHEVDWKRFHSIAKDYGLNVFGDTMTRLSVRYLNIPLPEDYEISDNDELDGVLLDDILHYKKIHDYGNKWKTRLSLVKSSFANRKRYKYFSDTTMFADLCKYFYGFCFDRKPRI